MSSRFAMMILLVRELDHREVTSFSAINALTLLLVYLVGMDLYISASRRIAVDKIEFHKLISNQLIFSGISCAIVVFATLLLGGESRILIAALIVSELVSQEVYRLHISHGSYHIANVVQFIKTGSWAVLVVALLAAGKINSIADILELWLIGSLSACLVGGMYLRRYFLEFKFAPSWPLFRSEFFRNVLIFSSSLSLLLFNTIDRLILERSSQESGAAYVFYATLAGSISTLIYAGVVNPAYSKIITANGDIRLVSSALRAMNRQIYILLLGAVTGVAITIYPLIVFIERPYLLQNIDILLVCMMNVVILAFAMMPHYKLLAFKRDAEIAIASVCGVLAHLITVVPLHALLSSLGVGISVAIGISAMALLKWLYVFRSATA